MSYKIFRKFVLYVGSVQASLLPTYRTSREGTAVGCVCLSVRLFSLYLLNYLTYVTHTHPFNGPLSGTAQVSRYQTGKTNLDFTEARDSEWQWHQLGHMQVCTWLQTDNHTSTPTTHVLLQAGCPSCRPTNSIKVLKALSYHWACVIKGGSTVLTVRVRYIIEAPLVLMGLSN